MAYEDSILEFMNSSYNFNTIFTDIDFFFVMSSNTKTNEYNHRYDLYQEYQFPYLYVSFFRWSEAPSDADY